MISNNKLASIFQVSRRQVIRWRQRGLTVEDPVHLLAELAEQRNSGRTYSMMIESPSFIRSIIQNLREIEDGAHKPVKLHKLNAAESCSGRRNQLRRRAKLLEAMTGEKWELDHIVPLSRGGVDTTSNIQVIPAKWNREKGGNPYWAPLHAPRWFKSPSMINVLAGTWGNEEANP
jgi:hypothetical protein